MPADQTSLDVSIGATGLTATRICIGTSALGDMPDTYGYGVDEQRAIDTINAVLDSPIRFLDTSRNYGFGRSEERVGKALRARGGLPDGFVLATKLDRNNETDRFDGDQARRSLEESLEALGIDRVPILHLHDPEYVPNLEQVTGPQGALQTLFEFKEKGLADAVGLAAGRVDVMMPLLDDWDFDAVITHNRFSLINRNAEAMIDKAHAKGVAVFNAAPYGGGVFAKGSDTYNRLTYQEASDEMLDPVRKIEAICAKYDIPPGAAALQFSMRDPRITSTICGCSRPERVAQTLEWANWSIPSGFWDDVAGIPVTYDDPEATRDYKLG
ncbi:MAG: aldo/keto reductase [Pseudomonadota bacterium]